MKKVIVWKVHEEAIIEKSKICCCLNYIIIKLISVPFQTLYKISLLGIFLYNIIFISEAFAFKGIPAKPLTLSGRPTGILPKVLGEISGLAHCLTTPNQLWAINDSGNKAYIYAISLDAKLLNKYFVKNVSNKDWEDLACGRCLDSPEECLYIGDIGDNDLKRRELQVVMIRLPFQIKSNNSIKKAYREKITLKYPRKSHDAETLLVHPKEPILIIATKEKKGSSKNHNSRFYMVDFSKKESTFKSTHILKYIGKIPLSYILGKNYPDQSDEITAGDFFPDGKTILLSGYNLIYRIPWPLPKKKKKRIILPIWNNFNRPQIESISVHINGKQFWIASEKLKSREPLILMEIRDGF